MDELDETPTNEVFILDSNYRGGALLIMFIASVLLAYSIYSAILFEKIRRKPSQSITYSESTAMFVISIIVAIFSGVMWIYSIVKLAINSEQRANIYRNAVAFANTPAGGVPVQGRITPQQFRDDVYVRRDDENERRQEELQEFVPKRNVFVDQVFNDSNRRFNRPVDVSKGYS
jgi:hypothetical protein